MLYGTLHNENDGVLKVVTAVAENMAKITQAPGEATAALTVVSEEGLTSGRSGPGASATLAAKRLFGGSLAASQTQKTTISEVTAAPSMSAEHFLSEAESVTTMFWATSALAMKHMQKMDKVIHPDPLDRWRLNAV